MPPNDRPGGVMFLTRKSRGGFVCDAAALPFRFFFRAAFFFCAAFTLFAQSESRAARADASLSPAIKALEKKLSSRLDPPEKNGAFRELARFMELSGNMESAARAWNEAALALPGRDYDAFVRCAACLAAAGEFENAAAAAKMGLLSQDSALRTKALLLVSQIEAFRSGNTESLRSFISEPVFMPYRPVMYYTIWKISGDETCRAKLLGEFPYSPEALLAKEEAIAVSTPLWLFGGAAAILAAKPVENPNQANQTNQSGQSSQTASPAEAESQALMLQTGLFSFEENAQAHAAKLRQAGFVPVVSAKTVNGANGWAVGVAPGQNPNKTILLLKDAGFEAFPVYSR